MSDDIQMHERLAKVETIVGLIKSNDLPHVQGKVDDIDIKVDKIDSRVWWILATVILGLLTSIVFKFVI